MKINYQKTDFKLQKPIIKSKHYYEKVLNQKINNNPEKNPFINIKN